MNDNNETIFKTVLYVDDKIVASSEDLTLWQNVLSSIKGNNFQSINTCGKKEVDETKVFEKKNAMPIEKFAQALDIDADLIRDAINPSLESPFIHLDMKTWENYKKDHFANKRPLPDVVIVGTILALWKKNANLEEATQKDVITVLKQLNLSSNNPSRSYKNCEWLKYENNKILLMASKYSLAQNMLKEYCESV